MYRALPTLSGFKLLFYYRWKYFTKCEQLQKSNLIKNIIIKPITAFIFETLSKYIYIVRILKGIDDLLGSDIIFKNKYC